MCGVGHKSPGFAQAQFILRENAKRRREQKFRDFVLRTQTTLFETFFQFEAGKENALFIVATRVGAATDRDDFCDTTKRHKRIQATLHSLECANARALQPKDN